MILLHDFIYCVIYMFYLFQGLQVLLVKKYKIQLSVLLFLFVYFLLFISLQQLISFFTKFQNFIYLIQYFCHKFSFVTRVKNLSFMHKPSIKHQVFFSRVKPQCQVILKIILIDTKTVFITTNQQLEKDSSSL